MQIQQPKKDVNDWNVVGTSSNGNTIQYAAATQKTTPTKISTPTVVVQNNTPSTNTKNPKDLTCLWVGNILPQVTENIIIQLFSKQGQVTSVRLLKEKFCAFIHFVDKNAAFYAIEGLQGVELCGRNLRIKFPDNPIVTTAQEVILRKNKNTTVVKASSPAAAAPTKQPVNGDECYFYRNTGCIFEDACKFKHISKNRGVDRKPWRK